ncbi:MAG: hypothetical protein AAGC55_00440 [Myxococcota bacterium]
MEVDGEESPGRTQSMRPGSTAVDGRARQGRVVATVVVIAVVIVIGGGGELGAQPESGPESEPEVGSDPGERPAAPTGPVVKRSVPDYDGRPAPPPSAGEAALLVPRAALWVPRLAVSYGLRRPIGWLLRTGERSRPLRRLIQRLRLPSSASFSVKPTAFYDFGFKPSVGVRFRWTRRFLRPGSKFLIKLATWGRNWLRIDFQEIMPLTSRFTLTIDADFWRRPDRVFHGFGPRAPQDVEGLFRYDRHKAQVTGQLRLAASSFGALYTGVRRRDFQGSNWRQRVSIDERVANGELAALPPGYESGYGIAATGARVDLDSRADGSGSGSGLVGEAYVEYAFDLGRPEQRWWRWGASAGAVLHLDRVAEKVVGLYVNAHFADPVNGSEIPFTEMVRLGGSRSMRGFKRGRLVDYSSAYALLNYRWPVASMIDATVYTGAGNVFGRRLSEFRPGLIRGMLGVGLSLVGNSKKRNAHVWTAFGTDPWDEGFAPSSFRVALSWQYAM